MRKNTRCVILPAAVFQAAGPVVAQPALLVSERPVKRTDQPHCDAQWPVPETRHAHVKQLELMNFAKWQITKTKKKKKNNNVSNKHSVNYIRKAMWCQTARAHTYTHTHVPSVILIAVSNLFFFFFLLFRFAPIFAYVERVAWSVLWRRTENARLKCSRLNDKRIRLRRCAEC